jgi:hypothetical protein
VGISVSLGPVGSVEQESYAHGPFKGPGVHKNRIISSAANLLGSPIQNADPLLFRT